MVLENFTRVVEAGKKKFMNVISPQNLKEVTRNSENWDSNSELKGNLPKGIDQQVSAMRGKSDELRYR